MSNRKCHKCGTKTKGDFCHNCGAKIKEIEKSIEKEVKSVEREVISHKQTYIGIGVIILIALFFVFTSAKPLEYSDKTPSTETKNYSDVEKYTEKEPYNVEKSYIEKESYELPVEYTEQICNDVTVPYEDTETYTEKEPFIEQKCTTSDYEYAIENHRIYGEFSGVNYIYYATLDIVNQEDKAGTWKIGYTFYGDNTVTKPTQSVYVYSNSRKTVKFDYDGDYLEDVSGNYNVVEVPERTDCTDVTIYKDVQKTRTVTKYRTEKRCEDITKTRMETRYRDVTKTKTEVEYKDVNKSKTLERVEDVIVYKNETRIKYVNRIFGYEQPFYWGY